MICPFKAFCTIYYFQIELLCLKKNLISFHLLVDSHTKTERGIKQQVPCISIRQTIIYSPRTVASSRSLRRRHSNKTELSSERSIVIVRLRPQSMFGNLFSLWFHQVELFLKDFCSLCLHENETFWWLVGGFKAFIKFITFSLSLTLHFALYFISISKNVIQASFRLQ